MYYCVLILSYCVLLYFALLNNSERYADGQQVTRWTVCGAFFGDLCCGGICILSARAPALCCAVCASCGGDPGKDQGKDQTPAGHYNERVRGCLTLSPPAKTKSHLSK